MLYAANFNKNPDITPEMYPVLLCHFQIATSNAPAVSETASELRGVADSVVSVGASNDVPERRNEFEKRFGTGLEREEDDVPEGEGEERGETDSLPEVGEVGNRPFDFGPGHYLSIQITNISTVGLDDTVFI